MSTNVNFKIPVMRVSQKEHSGQAIYSGKIQIKDIYEKNKQRFDIHIWQDSQPADKKGYQRSPSSDGIDKIINYMLNETETKNPLFPTSILVSCRQQLEFDPIQKDSEMGVLNITDTLWIIDGQHRIRAFEKIMSDPTIREREEFANYEIPIVIMTGFNVIQEIEQFFIINSRQRRVKTNLAQQIYLSLARENYHTKIVPEKDRWTLQAVKIAEILTNDSDYSNGVWSGRIALPNESKELSKLRLISQNSFVSSLKPLFVGAKNYFPQNPIDEKRGHEITEEGTEMIFRYWNTIKRVYEKMFQSPKDYSLFNTVGVFSMHLLLANIIYNNKGANLDKILEIAEEKLKIARDLGFNEGFWRIGNRIAAQKGRNAAAYSSSAGQNRIAEKIFMGSDILE